jgi:hypothetical protein
MDRFLNGRLAARRGASVSGNPMIFTAPARPGLSFALCVSRVPNQAASAALISWSLRARQDRVVKSPGPSPHTGGSGRLLNHSNRASNGIQVDQGVARKAKQKPESEMEETKTAAASEAL